MTYPRESARKRGYTRQWEKARAAYLAEHPLCAMCAPRVVPATVVDHITPHEGDQTLFWDRSNWQAVCQPHHDREKQSQDKRRATYSDEVDARGYPKDRGHPANFQ